jgi:3-phenylpropionate/trans-cinnamate dioxygenase ferredoxin reductase subunit
MPKPIVIVGAGQAAASFVSRHKALANKGIGNNEPLILIGEEPVPPYQRPPLSTAYMSGDLERDRLFIRPTQWYSEQNITTYFNTRVDSIDPQLRKLKTSDGQTIDYGKLILCTGSSPLSLPTRMGGDLAGVFTLRNIADAEAMAPELVLGRKLLIVGGGYIGLEAAAVARKFGLDVTVIEMAERILQRVAAPQTSDFFRMLHQQHDVDVRESTQLVRLTQKSDGLNSRVDGAELANGEQLEADLVLVGIGGRPNIKLADQSGLDCENGIAVNQICQTSNPDIFSAGDCASFMRNGQRIRLESVQNAADQGDLVARVIAGEAVTYDPLPWFWSDQYDCKLQIAGLNMGYTQTVIRPGSKPGGQSVWYYAQDKLLAVDAMNDTMAYALGRKMIGAGLHPSPDLIADPAIDLKTVSKK